MKKSIIVDIISCLFIILFLYTGIYKLLEPDSFRAAINKSPIIAPFQSLIVPGIPVLEILIACSLLFPLFKDNNSLRKWGLIASFFLMAIFTCYVGYMLWTASDHLPCSCGGIMRKMNWHQHMYFNTSFTLLALVGFILNKGIGQSIRNISFTS